MAVAIRCVLLACAVFAVDAARNEAEFCSELTVNEALSHSQTDSGLIAHDHPTTDPATLVLTTMYRRDDGKRKMVQVDPEHVVAHEAWMDFGALHWYVDYSPDSERNSTFEGQSISAKQFLEEQLGRYAHAINQAESMPHVRKLILQDHMGIMADIVANSEVLIALQKFAASRMKESITVFTCGGVQSPENFNRQLGNDAYKDLEISSSVNIVTDDGVLVDGQQNEDLADKLCAFTAGTNVHIPFSDCKH
mmetsp:Transcript_133671/g.236618  ORF Transcript_133671/g.236618 Transcript_133671/m.236618 type:complete len:250 (+) Transcript_133671:72-821(+)